MGNKNTYTIDFITPTDAKNYKTCNLDTDCFAA